MRDLLNPHHLMIGYSTTGVFKLDHTMVFLIFLPMFLFFNQVMTMIRYVMYKCGCWNQLKGTDLNWNFDI